MFTTPRTNDHIQRILHCSAAMADFDSIHVVLESPSL